MPRLTARGIAFTIGGVALAVTAYAAARPELLPLAAIFVAAPVIALTMVAAARPRVHVNRLLDPVVAREGEPVRVTLTVSGRARAAEWIERVSVWPGFAGPGRLADVRQTRPASLSYRYAPSRRGLQPVGPLLIEDRDPFALAVRVTDTRTTATQLVIPRVSPLSVGPVRDPSTEAGLRTRRSRERSDDDVVTREYRDGDALRRVHWRVTARHGELMVRQDEPHAGPTARLILDSCAASYPDAVAVRGSRDRLFESLTFEWAVRMAASVAVHLVERGYQVELVATGLDQSEVATQSAPIADGPAGAVLGRLAIIELTSASEHRPPPTVPRPPAGFAPVVAIAGDPDPAMMQWMLAQRGSAPAVALLVGGAFDDSRDRARDECVERDWAVARVDTHTAPDDAWLALIGLAPAADAEWAVPTEVARG